MIFIKEKNNEINVLHLFLFLTIFIVGCDKNSSRNETNRIDFSDNDNPIVDMLNRWNRPVNSRILPFLQSKYQIDNERLDKIVVNFMQKWELKGASVVISKHGNILYTKSYGFADAEEEIPATNNNLYRIASVSKLVTAVGIMKLVDEGKISLNQKVFGPDGILNCKPYDKYRDRRAEDIEIRHLLNHSGGWTSRWGDHMFIPYVVAKGLKIEMPVTAENIITFALSKKLHFTPGTYSSYSNLGYAILGKVIEKTTGQDYETYIKTAILLPIGITDMQIGGSYLHERLPAEVKYYEPGLDSIFVPDFSGSNEPVRRPYGGNDIKTLGSAGGWVATATDLVKLGLAIDGFPEYPDILSKVVIEQMVTVDSLQFDPYGWRGIIPDQYWYRTGTLSGSTALLVRQNDGFVYAIIFNTSSWMGTHFTNEIRRMMTKAIGEIDVRV